MSIRMSGVYFAPAITTPQTEKIANNTSGLEDQTDKANGAQQPNNKTVTILAPNRSNSLDYLNFEEKRQLIASSLSLSDILHCGPAAAAAAAKEVAANTVIGGKKQNGVAVRTNSLGGVGVWPPQLERKSKLSALGKLFKPWKWKRKKKSDKFEAASKSLERKISVRANREHLVQKGILLPDSPISPISEPGEHNSDQHASGVQLLASVTSSQSAQQLSHQSTQQLPLSQSAHQLQVTQLQQQQAQQLHAHLQHQHKQLHAQLQQNLQFANATSPTNSGKKQNGVAVRTNSLGGVGVWPPQLERKSKLSALGKLFKPWKWKRKKKSDKFEAASKSLERKISVRANREHLVQKGILLPDSPISPISEPGEHNSDQHASGVQLLASVSSSQSAQQLSHQSTQQLPLSQSAHQLQVTQLQQQQAQQLHAHLQHQHKQLHAQLQQNLQFANATSPTNSGE
ncbi:uncharacterized protein LOC113375238 [Ctenocephalides felis]|uniref:uncharacterized protein LOC113375238 n=1 Tax=Ctenocephalides felis TaxID=7515 RepID=UPI000E6E5528|nr:uncharacterized protein LOC113375238 [Ctenocephalides felis]